MRFETAIEHLVDNYRYAKSKVWIRDEVAWALYHTWKEADDRKTEPQLTPNYCGTCRHRDVPCGDLPCDVCHGYSNYEPKDKPKTQMKTQNSNLTFEKRTMRDCYNCKRYETEGECIECHYEPKDECAKEYEELGLKELKKLIEADRKTEPNNSEIPNNCEHITEDGVTCAKYPACDDCLDNPLNKVKGSERLVKGSEQTEPTISKMEQVETMSCQECKHFHENAVMYLDQCDFCFKDCKYEPKTEPQTERDKLINAVVKLDMSREDKFKVIELLEQHCEKCKHYLFTDIDGYYCEHETYGQRCAYEPKDEPQTDCAWR